MSESRIAGPIRHLAVPIDDLKPYGKNPRRGDLDLISESLRVNGQYRPVVANRRTGEILAGNHTWKTAKRDGWPEIAVTWVDVDDEAARRIVAVDNRSNDQAEYDDRLLAELLAEVDDLAGTGYGPADLDEITKRLLDEGSDAGGGGLTGPDDTPEPPAVPRSKLGDVWRLGDHRLMCGSSIQRDDVACLLDDDRPDVMVSDPPYGVAVGGDKGKNSISGDLTQAAIPVAFLLAVEHLGEDGRIYLFGGSTNWAMYAGLFDVHLRMQVRPIVWVKEMFVLRPNNYHSQFEMVYFGWKGKGGSSQFWYGDRKTSDVWQVRRDTDRVHPTQKPVEVCEIPIRNSCPPGGLVYEPFGGSGTTLIAAERLGRRCYAMELDPHYVDVICRRYQEHTGTLPVYEATGDAVDFVKGHG